MGLDRHFCPGCGATWKHKRYVCRRNGCRFEFEGKPRGSVTFRECMEAETWMANDVDLAAVLRAFAKAQEEER